MPRGIAKTTQTGYENRNGQVVVRKTDLPGNDHYQYVYVLECGRCGHRYGANGSDIWQRLCPRCGGGRPGLNYREPQPQQRAEPTGSQGSDTLDRVFPAVDMGPWPEGFSANREEIYDDTERLMGGLREDAGSDG